MTSQAEVVYGCAAFAAFCALMRQLQMKCVMQQIYVFILLQLICTKQSQNTFSFHCEHVLYIYL